MNLPLNQVILGNCINIMAEWPENSVDLIVTDPPYGIQFMGLDFDKALPPKEAFKQMIRVLKPGALAFVMSSPRQDVLWRMLSMLEGVGFELRQSHLSWITKTGFPKAYDVSAGIDRRQGGLIDRDSLGAFISKHRKSAGLSRQNASELVTGNRTGAFWNWENNYRLPFPELWPKIKEVIKAPDSEWDEKLSSAERKILVERTMIQGGGRSYELRLGERREVEANITAPNLDLAKKWSGWKSQTGLKPAVEMVLMVNKPRSEKTIVENVLKWGTGAINVDACRIPFQGLVDKESSKHNWKPDSEYSANETIYEYGSKKLSTHQSQKGRFPANLLISDGALDTGETTGGGIYSTANPNLKTTIFPPEEGWNKHSMTRDKGVAPVNYGDEGSPFRFFDLDAWAEHHGFLDVAKPSRAERDFGLTTQPLQVPKSKFNLNDGSKDMRFDGVIPTPRRNVHPTCKPVKLMAYLIELGCPPKGIVVDPFLGSGTTCIAAKRLRRQWIGIEINPEYAEIAEARINIRGPWTRSWRLRNE